MASGKRDKYWFSLNKDKYLIKTSISFFQTCTNHTNLLSFWTFQWRHSAATIHGLTGSCKFKIFIFLCGKVSKITISLSKLRRTIFYWTLLCWDAFYIYFSPLLFWWIVRNWPIIDTLPQGVRNRTLIRLFLHEVWTCFAEYRKRRWWTTIHPFNFHVFSELGNRLIMISLVVLWFDLIDFFMIRRLMNLNLDRWFRRMNLTSWAIFDWLTMRSTLVVWVDNVHTKWRVILFFLSRFEGFCDLNNISFYLFRGLTNPYRLPIII